MKLKNKYAFGLLIQWYEVEMLDEHIQSCVQMLEAVENKENVTFVFCISTQEYLEQIDWGSLNEIDSKFGYYPNNRLGYLKDILERKIGVKGFFPASHRYQFKTNQDEFYNIASFRRDFNWEWQDKVDILCWSETDSLWPKQTLELLDSLHEHVKEQTPKYICNFADRRLWDNSFAPLHPMFEKESFQENEEWQFENEASGKAYMSLERMNKINQIPIEEVQVVSFTEPRFDGSCVCFSSDLIKSGINIPHGLIHCSEDVSLGVIAKKLLGDQFVQYCAINLLHVHNRRHPEKRNYILNEENKRGFCDNRKGEWWKILEDSSKENFNNLFQQKPFIKMNEVLEKINKSKK